MNLALLGLAGTALATSAAGQDPLAPLATPAVPVQPAPEPQGPPPTDSPGSVETSATAVPVPVVRVPRDWRETFAAIRTGNWASAQAGIAALPYGPLTAVARAELYTARGSPAVSLGQIQSLLAEAPDLPRAEQLARLAVTRGARTPPPVIAPRPLAFLGGAQGRSRARPVAGEVAADQLRAQIEPFNQANDAQNAELLLIQAGAALSYEARAEAGQRVAWIYYRNGYDAEARRVADSWRAGASGEWASQAAWVSGLASWRLNDCESASRAFREAARLSRERELTAAAHFWTARAEQACRRPQSVTPLLRAAAASAESFYGLLARESLGSDKSLPSYAIGPAPGVEQLPNVRRAMALAAIGEVWLADEMLRHQARIGSPAQHQGLVEVAKRLDLASAQYWLARNGPRGAAVQPRDRYPAPNWAPPGGWRVDPALAFAHIMQESTFRSDAISPVGAVGLMQVMPTTADEVVRARGLPYTRNQLTNPAVNLEFGQTYIERLRGLGSTQGQLPKIIAAYNAGPLPVARWTINDRGDPLLWIESIPYWETRYYVPAVMRNLWIYQVMAGSETPTLSAMVQHKWPAFPTAHTQVIARRDGSAGSSDGSTP